MTRSDRAPWHWLLALVLCVVAGCGGESSGNSSANAPATPSTPSANVLAMRMDGGTDGSAINSPYVTVTVCAPGSQSNCQTIDHVLVDTGSFGLRLAAAVVGVNLPVVAAPGGGALADCAQFVSGYAWGSVRAADVHMGSETAAAVPIQIVDDPASSFANVPAACSARGPHFGVGPSVNGILGVGLQAQDCGPACAASTVPAMYFACASGCSDTVAPLAVQVVNPVAALPVDNNGVVLLAPAVPTGGTGPLDGQLVFGIGTQANNQLGSATVYTANVLGQFFTTYKGVTYPAFIDSGSNAYFFHDTSLRACVGGSGFYCPPSPTSLSATVVSAAGASRDVGFSVESVLQLPVSVHNANIAADSGANGDFDWGMPFFFGRAVFVAISGASTPAGAGPYWAF